MNGIRLPTILWADGGDCSERSVPHADAGVDEPEGLPRPCGKIRQRSTIGKSYVDYGILS